MPSDGAAVVVGDRDVRERGSGLPLSVSRLEPESPVRWAARGSQAERPHTPRRVRGEKGCGVVIECGIVGTFTAGRLSVRTPVGAFCCSDQGRPPCAGMVLAGVGVGGV